MYYLQKNYIETKDNDGLLYPRIIFNNCLSSISLTKKNPFLLGQQSIKTGDIFRRLLLHLRQFDHSEITRASFLKNEVEKIIEDLRSLRRHVPNQLYDVTYESRDLADTKLDIVESTVAQAIHTAYHYLGSARRDAIHLGLRCNSCSTHRNKLLSLVALSPLDIPHLINALPSNVNRNEVLVLSRLFAFNNVPSNTISFTLGRVFKWLRNELPNIKMLISYLDPNIGFSGSVYRATNWKIFAREKKTRYLYIDSKYVTDRYVIETYGSTNLSTLQKILGSRIKRSKMPVQPLDIYYYLLDPKLKNDDSSSKMLELIPYSK